MNLTARLATIILVSGVTLFVVYRCYKYGSVFGEQQNKREEKTGEEEKTGKGAASASESSRSASNSKMSLKRKKDRRRRRRRRRRAARARSSSTSPIVPSALHESSTDSSSVIKQ